MWGQLTHHTSSSSSKRRKALCDWGQVTSSTGVERAIIYTRTCHRSSVGVDWAILYMRTGHRSSADVGRAIVYIRTGHRSSVGVDWAIPYMRTGHRSSASSYETEHSTSEHIAGLHCLRETLFTSEGGSHIVSRYRGTGHRASTAAESDPWRTTDPEALRETIV